MVLVLPLRGGLTFAGRACQCFQASRGYWVGSTPPGLRFLRGLCRGLPHPPSPEGVGGQGARPAPAVRRRQGGRAIPPAQHPKMPCSRRSSRRAGASSLPEGGNEPDAWSGGRFPGALLPSPSAHTLRCCRCSTRASTPGFVDSSLPRVPSSGKPSEGGRPRPDWVARGHRERWTTKSLAGLLSWVVSKIAPSSTSVRVSTPSSLPSSTERGVHRGGQVAASRVPDRRLRLQQAAAFHDVLVRTLRPSRLHCVPSATGCQTDGHVPPSPFLTTSTAFSTHTLQVCCTLLPTMGFAWLQATDVGHSAAYQHAMCKHVLLDPATPLESRPLRALRPRRDLSVPPSPEDGTSVRRVPTRRQTLPFRAHHTTHPSCCHDWLQDVAILARRPGSTDPLALVARSRRTRPDEEVRPSRSRHCCRHTKSARSTGSRCSRAIPSGAVALRSFSLVHSAMEAAGCPAFSAPGHPGRCLPVVTSRSLSKRAVGSHRGGVPERSSLRAARPTSRPCSVSESVAFTPLALCDGPMLPWACLLLQRAGGVPASVVLRPDPEIPVPSLPS